MQNKLRDRLFKEKMKSRIPRGELWISDTLLQELGLERKQESIITLNTRIGADICFFSYTSPVQSISVKSNEMELNINKAHDLDMFCGVTVDGPFQRTVKEQGFIEVMKCFYHEGCLKEHFEFHTAMAAAEMEAAEKAGADLLILCDDIAYTKGLYFSPQQFVNNVLPFYQRLRHSVKETTMGFHSDGNVEQILNFIIEQGYSVFSLEPEAMDLSSLCRILPENAILLSGIKANWLMGINSPVHRQKKEIIDYVNELNNSCTLLLASLCGLYNVNSLNNLRELYELVK